ncbi:MAG: TRAP transporter small permease subunit [Pseudomonadota bacterium]
MARLVRLTDALSALALALLLGVVAGSVATRALYDATGGSVNLLVPGAIELAGLALSLMVFAALPGAALRGLARVDILLERLPLRLSRPLSRFWDLALAAAAGLLAWLLVGRATVELRAGHLSQDLGWLLWPFTAFAAMAALLLMLAALWRCLRPGGAQAGGAERGGAP